MLKANLLKPQYRITYYANQHRLERSFEEGDEVFLRTQDFRQTSLKNVKDNKFSARYYGPYKILKKIGTVAYRLELPTDARIHNTFHVSLLKKHVGNHSTSPTLPPVTPLSAKLEPEAILDRRLLKKNNKPGVALLIKWKGQVPEDASWEDYDEIKSKFPTFIGEVAAVQEEGIVTKGKRGEIAPK